MPLLQKTFKRLPYPVDTIAPCVRGYLDYALSLRNREEMMAARGIGGDHATLSRGVHRMMPLIVRAIAARDSGRHHWRRDETDINIKGEEWQPETPKENPPFWQAFKFDLLPSGLKSCDDTPNIQCI